MAAHAHKLLATADDGGWVDFGQIGTEIGSVPEHLPPSPSVSRSHVLAGLLLLRTRAEDHPCLLQYLAGATFRLTSMLDVAGHSEIRWNGYL